MRDYLITIRFAEENVHKAWRLGRFIEDLLIEHSDDYLGFNVFEHHHKPEITSAQPAFVSRRIDN